MLLQESVSGDDITVGVSSPTTYIQSHEDSVPAIVNPGDGLVVASNTPVTFDSIQPSNVLIPSNTNAVTAVLEQTSPAALAVDLTTSISPELPTVEAAASRYTYFLMM